MDLPQKAVGTLVPLFSLTSKTHEHHTLEVGIEFLDWLQRTRQKAWQLLPIHETQFIKGTTNHVSSPYKGYGIGLSPRYLSKEAANLKPSEKELSEFLSVHKKWIYDYALFCTARDHFKTDNWVEWEDGLKKREENAIQIFQKNHSKQIQQYVLSQWQLHHVYAKLRKKARALGIMLIGDFPFYMSFKSPLVWTNQELFDISENGEMLRASGLPLGPKSHYGRQFWGHPLYKWKEKSLIPYILNLWKLRFRYISTLFNMVRIDHAKGFFYYGSLDSKNETTDTIVDGPGKTVFEELLMYCNSIGLRLYAEDTGDKLKELRASLKEHSVPGIRIYRFAFNEKLEKINDQYARVFSYPHNSLAYTTTHDTEPLMGYLSILTRDEKKNLAKESDIVYSSDDEVFAVNIRTAVINSPARIVIISMQDWLLTKNRINIPGTEKEIGDKNWQYQLNIPVEELPHSIV